MKYDKQAHAEAVAYLAAKEKELNEIAVKVNDNAETDEWTDQKSMAHSALANQHMVVSSEVKLARDKVSTFEDIQRITRKSNREPSAFSRFLAQGSNGLTAEEKQEGNLNGDNTHVAAGATESFTFKVPDVSAYTRTDDSSAQEAVPETVSPDVIEALAFQGEGVMNLTYRFATTSGNEYRRLQFDEATEEGFILGNQSAAVTTKNLADINVVTFYAKTVSSGFMYITNEAIQDSIVGLEAFATRHGGRRIMRTIEKNITLDGDGSSNTALSVINGSQDGINTATADTLAWEDLVNLQYAVPRAYRSGGERGPYANNELPGIVGYCIPDSFEKLVMLMKDGEGRPIWMPQASSGIGGGYPGRIFGYPYSVSMDGVWSDLSSASATGDVLCAFGNWAYFGRRTVRDIVVHRMMDSGTLVNNAIAYVMFMRFDFRPFGALGTAGNANKTAAVRLLKNT